jgi:DNA-binding response OmpR family regulator
MEPDAQLAPRVLLAVNDALLRRIASVTLRERGFSVSATTEGSAALMLAESFNPDVILVDLEMPAPHGGSVFDIVRSKSEAYLIAIAPAEADTVRIRALRAGADDVVSVPVSPEELAARCQALLRRPRNLHTRWDPMAASVIALGPLSVDVGRKEIQVHGQDVPVTRIEFALFEQLCRSAFTHPTARRGVGPELGGRHPRRRRAPVEPAAQAAATGARPALHPHRARCGFPPQHRSAPLRRRGRQ